MFFYTHHVFWINMLKRQSSLSRLGLNESCVRSSGRRVVGRRILYSLPSASESDLLPRSHELIAIG